MLRLLDATGPTRREWLRLEGWHLAAWAAGARRSATAAATGTSNAASRTSTQLGRAKSVIFLVVGGGQSQLETWDPKPQAPAEIRGQFGTIPTTLPGVRLCEHLPRLARLTRHYAIVRSMTHDDLDHGSALYATLTGRFHPRKSSNPPPKPSDFPTLAALLHQVRPRSTSDVARPYSAVHINGPILIPEEVGPGQFGGFLGRAVEPLSVPHPTAGEGLFQDLLPQTELPTIRLQQRQTLLQALDATVADWGRERRCLDHQTFTRQAFELLASAEGRRAFELHHEPQRLRQRYGLWRAGQACLLARRLVEAGVPWITVFFNRSVRGQDKSTATEAYGWDTHNDIFEAMQQHLLPPFDQTFSALLEDLHDRGLLDQTLVVCAGEFGRAPKVAFEPGFAGRSPGRKHWAGAYSVVLAGGGVRGGQVFGESDAIAAYVKERPVGPADLAATMFAALGIDPATHYHDALARPFAVSVGQPIYGLF